MLDHPVEREAEWAIDRLRAAAAELEAAVALARAAAGDADRRAGQYEIREMNHAVGRTNQLGVEPRLAARQPAEEQIVEPLDHRLAGAVDDRADAVGPGQDRKLGIDVDDAEAGNQIARQPARQCGIEAPRDQIDPQQQLALELVRGEREIVAGDRLAVDRERARQIEIGEDAAGNRADPGHLRGMQPDRQDERHAADMPRARRPHGIEAGRIEGEMRARQRIMESGGPERAIQLGMEADIVAGHVGKERRRPQQLRIDLQAGKGAGRQIDRAVRREAERRTRQADPAVELAIGERPLARDLDAGLGQALELALQEGRRRHHPRQRIAPVTHPEHEIGDRLAGEQTVRMPVPDMPAALPADGERDPIAHAD